MRHGESLANRQGLIVSKPANGVAAYGLSDTGRQQADDSLKRETRLDSQTVIISSDFKRAVDTARIASERLGVDVPLTFDERLRERDFGDLELTDVSNYRKIWVLDKEDPDHTSDGVESVNAVVARLCGLLKDIDQRYSDKNILLVSHGDILQILQAVIERLPPANHRSVNHLGTAEIRQLSPC